MYPMYISKHKAVATTTNLRLETACQKVNKKPYNAVRVDLLRNWPDKGLQFYKQGFSQRALEKNAHKYMRDLDRAKFVAKETRKRKTPEFEKLNAKAEFEIKLYTALLFDARDMPRDFLFWARCVIEYTDSGQPVLVSNKEAL